MNLPTVVPLCSLPAQLPAEQINILTSGSRFRLEHILSAAHTSAADFWYDQAQAEWAILLAGHAALEFEAGVIELRAGDALLIPAHKKHRVARSSDAVWLALHFE